MLLQRKVGSFYYKIYAKYNQITGRGFYTTQQGKYVHKIILSDFVRQYL